MVTVAEFSGLSIISGLASGGTSNPTENTSSHSGMLAAAPNMLTVNSSDVRELFLKQILVSGVLSKSSPATHNENIVNHGQYQYQIKQPIDHYVAVTYLDTTKYNCESIYVLYYYM